MEEEGGGDWSGLEPFFYDEAAAKADGERAMEMQRQKERKQAERKAWEEACIAAMDKIYEYDPKLGDHTYTRLLCRDFATFDLDEESSIGPMRRTRTADERDGDHRLGKSANVLSVNIISSDVGYPLLVYGTVIARDVLDHKCLYLFRRSRDDSQLITSKDETLFLTGPPRALVVSDSIFFEVHLKLKEDDDDDDHVDKDLSKGLIEFRSLCMPSYVDAVDVGSCCPLDSRLSTVELSYAYISGAVEAAVEISLLPVGAGPGAGADEDDARRYRFHGQITACSSSIPDASIALYDSSKQIKAAASATSNSAGGGGGGVVAVEHARRVMAVRAADELVLTVSPARMPEHAAGDDGRHRRTDVVVEFTPRINGSESAETICGIYKLLIKVSWSSL